MEMRNVKHETVFRLKIVGIKISFVKQVEPNNTHTHSKHGFGIKLHY